MRLYNKQPLNIDTIVLFYGILSIAIGVLGIHFSHDVSWVKFYDNVHWTAATSASGALLWISYKRSSTVNSIAIFWFMLGFVGYAIGQFFWDIQVFLNYDAFPATSDIFYLMLGPCITIGLMKEVRSKVSASETRSAWQDSLMLSVAITTFILVLYLPKRGDTELFPLLILIAYPALLLTATGTALIATLTLRTRFTSALFLSLSGLIATAVSWMHWNFLALDGIIVDGSWFNIIFSIAVLMAGVGFSRWNIDDVCSLRSDRIYAGFLRMLPIAAVIMAALSVILTESMNTHPPLVKNITDVGAAIVIILSIVRQSSLLKERDQLLFARKSLDEAQNKLNHERELLKSLVSSVSDLIWLKDPEGVFLNCNPVFERMYGAKEHEIIGKTDYDFVDKHLADFFRRNDKIAMEANKPCTNEEWLTFASDGYRGFFETIKTPMRDSNGNIIGVIGVARDITERKKSEQQKEQYDKFFKLSTDPMCIADQYWSLKKVNSAFVRLMGCSEEELLNISFLDFIPPEDREKTATEFKTQFSLNPLWNFENRYVFEGGEEKLLSWTAYFDREQGLIYAMTKDITLQRKSEFELRIAAIAFESQEGMFVTDMCSVIIKTNQAFTTITGYQAEEVIGKTPRLIASGLHDALFYADMWQALHSNGRWAGEILNRRKNGEVYPEYLSITAVKDANGVVVNYVASLIDISESKQREQQRILDEALLRQTLLREVHHRIKNNLQGVSSLLGHFVSKAPALAVPVSEALSQIQSIAVIHGLQGSTMLMCVGLCELVRNVAANNKTLWKTSIIEESPLPLSECLVSETEAVNIALVLNELIANAIKHGDAEKCVHITYEYSLSPLQVQVLIANTGQLSVDGNLTKTFALLPEAGTGLGLVSSLLGKSGSVVTWEQCGDIVIAKLELKPPVISIKYEQPST